MTKKCPKCGGNIPDNAAACPKCGTAPGGEAIVVTGDKLTPEQEKQFNAGKSVEFATGALSQEALLDIEAMNDMKIDEVLIEGGVEPAPTPAPTPEPEPPHQPDFSFDGDDEEDILIQEGVTEIKKFTFPKPLKTALLWVFSILLFFSLGFGTHLYLSQGVFDGYVDSIAADSLDAVLRRIPADSRYEAYEIYVSREPDITECIIFGVVMRELQNPEPSHYRLVITNNNRANATLYNPFNQAEYDRLVTGTSEERLHADTMMHHYERFLQSADEINANNPRWKRANTEKINSRLTK